MSYGYQGPPVMPFQGQRPPTSFGAPPGAPSAPGAPPYPQSSNVGFNHPPTSFGMPQPYTSHGSTPYPSQPSPYAPQQQQQQSPYGQHQPSHAQQQPGYSPYPSSPYPAQPSSYTPKNDNSPYPTHQNSPYPSGQNSPYAPQSTQQSPYAPQSTQQSPYAPQSTQQSPYPPQSTQQSPYPPARNSPYPQQSPYPPVQKMPFSSPSSHFPADNSQQGSLYGHNPSKYQQQTLHGQYSPGHNQHAYSGAGGRPQSAPYPNSGNPSPYPANVSFPSNSASNPGGMYAGGQGTGGTLYPSCAGLTSSAQHYQNSPAPRRTQYKSKLSPTVVPYGDFDPRADAEVLRKAMKGFGTDEKSIINVLANRSNLQRQEIATQFKTLYGKDLIKDLKSELSGNFEDLVVAMMTPLPQYYAKELNNAMSGIGTDECVLIEVLCTMSNHEIRVIKQAYECMYGRTLEDDLRGDTSGSFKRLMVSLCCANRDESFDVDPSAAMEDARQLLQAGELRFGTDESTFNAILVQRNIAQLHQIFQEYQGITGHTIEEAIENEFSGDIKKGLLAIVKVVSNRAGFFAEQLYKSMKGMGTDDRRLIRLVVTRSEIDMGEIKQAFAQEFGQTLEDFISGDCSGHYKKCLLALIV